MSNLLEKLLVERRHETKLHTGRVVGWHYPDKNECILAVGQIPLGALSAGKKKPTEAQAMKIIADSPDVMARGREYQVLMVATMLDDIDGQAIDPEDDRKAIARALDPSELDELFLFADRQKDPNSGEA